MGSKPSVKEQIPWDPQVGTALKPTKIQLQVFGQLQKKKRPQIIFVPILFHCSFAMLLYNPSHQEEDFKPPPFESVLIRCFGQQKTAEVNSSVQA